MKKPIFPDYAQTHPTLYSTRVRIKAEYNDQWYYVVVSASSVKRLIEEAYKAMPFYRITRENVSMMSENDAEGKKRVHELCEFQGTEVERFKKMQPWLERNPSELIGINPDKPPMVPMIVDLTPNEPSYAERQAGIVAVSSEKCDNCGASMTVKYGGTGGYSGFTLTIKHLKGFDCKL